jgi:hypothetical protein
VSLSSYFVRREYGAFRAAVSPQVVRYGKTASEWPGYVRRWPFLLCPGTWDLTEEEYAPFREKLMRELFVEDRPYTETGTYQWLMELVEEGGHTSAYPCGSREEVVQYFEGVKQLGRSIRENGVIPPSDGETEPRDGITIRIARDGSLLKCGEGTHRLAIARVLKVPRVPVVIDLVHTKWARREIRRTGQGGRRGLEEALQRLGA